MKSNREWQYWGTQDPLYGVITRPSTEAASDDAWTPASFFEQGESAFAAVVHQWAQYGMGTRTDVPRFGSCIEIGCGAGRMTRQLLRHFDKVVAIDVAEGQINKAQEFLAQGFFGERDARSRIDFHLVEHPGIPVADGTSAGRVSFEVFQHLSDFSGVVRYLELTYAKLKPGATTCFHVPVIGAHELSMRRVAYFYARRVAIGFRRQWGSPRLMDYRVAVPTEVLRACRRIGFHDVEMRVFPTDPDGEMFSFFFARKPTDIRLCSCGHDLDSQHCGIHFCYQCNCRRPFGAEIG